MVIGRAPGSCSSPSSGEDTLSGLLAVLDRAEVLPPAGRPRPRRAARHTSTNARGRRELPAARPVPQPRPRPLALVAVPPAPVMWRPAASRDEPTAPVPTRRPGLTRRLALWGAGPDGAHLAWNRPAPTPARGPASAPTPARSPASAPARPVGLRERLRRGVRRLALWGAGPTGAHLAWNVPPQPPVYSLRLPPRSAATAAVVLTERPSTPSNEPAAPSPAAALPPAPRAALPEPSGWPIREASGPRAGSRSPGRARTRGDPAPCRIRGAPP